MVEKVRLSVGGEVEQQCRALSERRRLGKETGE
jgi:hypothetical protein